MRATIKMLVAATMLAGGVGAATAQGYYGGSNLNSNGSLAGKRYKGSPGGVKTSPVLRGPTDGADSGLWNTTNSLAGIETRHRGW